MRHAVILALALALAAPAAAAAETKVVTFSPLGADGGLRAGLTAIPAGGGSCESGSLRAAGALRCAAGVVIRDPCYPDAAHSTAVLPVVLCVRDPWSPGVVRLHLTGPADPAHGVAAGTRPWALRLVSGRRCVAVTAAAPTVRGRRMTYTCRDGDTVLFGPLDRSGPTWRIRQAHGVSGPQRPVAVALAYG
jgi:hypothetical protein